MRMGYRLDIMLSVNDSYLPHAAATTASIVDNGCCKNQIWTQKPKYTQIQDKLVDSLAE